MFKFIILSLNIMSLSLALAETKFESWQGTFNLKQGDTNSELNITKCKNKKCNFVIIGATGSHTCEAEGAMTIADDNLSATQDLNIEEKEICLTKFNLKPNEILKVEALYNNECQVSCGAGAHYDGDYKRQGKDLNFKTGFNCKKASTSIEKAICADQLLALGDLFLSLEYAKIQKNSSFKEATKVSQKDWIDKRNQECQSDKNLKECLLKKYRMRILELVQLPLKKNIDVSNTPNYWVFNNLKFASIHLPNGFLVTSAIYLGYGKDVLEDFEHYRLDYSTIKETNNLYSIEGWILGMGSSRVLLTIDPKFVWVTFKNEDNDTKKKSNLKAPVGANQNDAPELLKKWIQEK